MRSPCLYSLRAHQAEISFIVHAHVRWIAGVSQSAHTVMLRLFKHIRVASIASEQRSHRYTTAIAIAMLRAVAEKAAAQVAIVSKRGQHVLPARRTGEHARLLPMNAHAGKPSAIRAYVPANRSGKPTPKACIITGPEPMGANACLAPAICAYMVTGARTARAAP